MRLVVQPADDLAFERIVNVPRRGIGEVALRAMHETARANATSLMEAAAKLVAAGELRGQARSQLSELLRGFARWRDMLETDGHIVTVATLLDESGYTEMWQKDKSPDAPTRLENLKELLRALSEFETLAGFLDHVSLVMENDEAADGDRVSLMTLHAAKGLEFDTVFLPGWEEGLFPNQRALDEGGVKSLEEERRLAYVGLTRARRRAVVSYTANRRIYTNWQSSIPSRFIEELPDADVERAGSAALAREAAVSLTMFPRQFPVVARRQRTTEAWDQPARPARTDVIPVGARVFHQKFGYGTVRAAEDERLDVAFDKAGEKRVLDRFVEKVGD
jgi:DNA helicase-2/ATP-dependent DNA helicase PcrA